MRTSWPRWAPRCSAGARPKLERVAAEIGEDGGRAITRAFDIRDEEAVKANIAEVVAGHGAIHGLSTTPAASSRRR